jgi:hypothetical protein
MPNPACNRFGDSPLPPQARRKEKGVKSLVGNALRFTLKRFVAFSARGRNAKSRPCFKRPIPSEFF